MAIQPDARIVGVDIDPVVLAHARAHGDDPAPTGATVIAGDGLELQEHRHGALAHWRPDGEVDAKAARCARCCRPQGESGLI